MSFDTSGFGDTGNPILGAASVTSSYRTKGSPTDLKDVTQVASIATSGVSTESYQYDTEGRISAKTLTLNSRSSYPMVTDYIYDSLDRTVDVRYPAQYGNGSQLRKVVHHNYDEASRLSSITYDSQSFASNITYNAANQTTSLNVGNGTNQMVENYNYSAQTGLPTSQTVARTATPSTYLMNLSYDFAGANGKRTGQLAKITNNLDNNKNRGYEYDGAKEGQGLFLIISIAPEDFTRDRMTQLARQLNQDFSDRQKVDVSIFDNETVAKDVVPAGAHYVDFKAAERGIYHLDRAKNVEYIQFSTRPGRPANEVKLNLRRSRSKPRKTT